jgi:SAM-dependent methyltransferase
MQPVGCGLAEPDLSYPFTLLKFCILIIATRYCQIISRLGDKRMTNIQFQDLDWEILRQQASRKNTRLHKNAADWDKKARSFAGRTAHSVYTEKFMELLAPAPDWSVLDIGCGPGTLALPVAACTRQVTAIDFSGKMLKILADRAAELGLHNITTRQISWDDNWRQQGIKPHDVAIASRSLAVHDLKKALTRLNSFATSRICITDRVRHGPKDPDAFAAVGRELPAGPDYIYTVNLLYQMGILPTVDYIPLEKSMKYRSFDEAVAGYSWMFHSLDQNEEKLLKKYVRSISSTGRDGTVTVQRRIVPTWAYISWTPTNPDKA